MFAAQQRKEWPSENRISEQEYQRGVQEAHALVGAAGDGREAAEERLYNLRIDYKLGKDFPVHKRHALLAAHHQLRKQQENAVTELLAKQLTPAEYAGFLERAVDEMAQQMANVLEPNEYRALFEAEPGERASLPIDVAKLASQLP